MVDKYYLYEITDNINSFIYIGITNDFSRRRREHLNNPSNKYLKEINKDILIFKVLCIGSISYIAELEIKLIKLYRDSSFNIINILDGGEVPSGLKGEEHWNSILTEDKVILIREIFAQNIITQRDLAELFNIGYKAISKIVRGDRWKEIGGPITIEKLSISKVANRAKIKKEEVPNIRINAKNMYELGNLNIPKFAESLGIARQNLRLLLLGNTWKELPGPLLKVDYWSDYGR